MGKTKKKKKENKKRNITENVVLEKPNVRLKISASPEDWMAFRDYYIARKIDLFKDLFPYMQQAYFKALPKSTHKKNCHLVRLMQKQSALLYGFMRYVIQNSLWDKLPSLEKIKVGEDIDKNNPKEITFYFMGCVYRDIANYYKLKVFTGNQERLYDKIETFFNKYIKKGEQILLQNCKNLYDASSLVYNLPKIADVGAIDVYEFLFNLNLSICSEYRNPISGEISKNANNPKELDLMKSILIRASTSPSRLE